MAPGYSGVPLAPTLARLLVRSVKPERAVVSGVKIVSYCLFCDSLYFVLVAETRTFLEAALAGDQGQPPRNIQQFQKSAEERGLVTP